LLLICYLWSTYHATLYGLQPYLHESRHIHALNRVRGSGGRFLSTKKLQRSDPTSSHGQCNVLDTIHLHPKNNASELESFQSRTGQSSASNTTRSDTTSVSNSDVNFRQPDRGFSGIAAHLVGGRQINGGLMSSGNQHHASVVRWKCGIRRPCHRSRQFILGFVSLLGTKSAWRTLLCIWFLCCLLSFYIYILCLSTWLKRVCLWNPSSGCTDC